MKSVSSAVLLIGSIWAIVFWIGEVQARDVPCTTPAQRPGLCVAIQRCRNINNIVNNPIPPSKGIANYIKKAACDIPGIARSVCCAPQEVVLRSSNVPTPTTTSRSCPRLSTQKLLPQECGKSVTDRVSNGNTTRVFEYPWMAVVRYDENGRIIDGCGGSLINERFVLTAAHCIKMRSVRKLHSVILGEHTKGQALDCNVFELDGNVEQDCADPAEEFGIESFQIHDDYNNPKFSNDIGLLRLNKDVTMKDHIKPICLPITADVQHQTFPKYILTGWGTTENGSPSNELLQAYLPRVENQACLQKLKARRMNIQLSSKQMCAGDENLVDACKGDSGGPLGAFANYRGGARFVQYGIVTTGVDSCGQINVPGVYCRVADYMDWILDKIQPSC